MTQFRWGASTDVGRARSNNQDAPLAVEGLFAVADGMGGHRGGEVASQLAVRSLEDAFAEADEPTSEALLDAVQRANETIFATSRDDPDLRGMGTTLTAIAPVDAEGEDVVAVVNVGDSRTYLFRDGELEQLTEDHSLVEEMVREGRLSPEEALLHPQRNIVTRALGIDPRVEIDQFTVTPYVGDRYLLCSDGLFNEVDDSRIAATLRRLADPTDAARELIRLANESGGRDNITCVVVDVIDDDDRAGKASAALRGDTTAAHTDMAGFTTRSSPPQPAADADGDTERAAGRASRAERKEARRTHRAERPRRLTWRVAIFAVVLLAVLVTAAGAIGWQARNTFYVGFSGDDVVVFRGKPGGVLWFDPTFEEGTDLTRSDVPAARIRDLENGKEFGDLAGARSYVENLREQSDPPSTTSTTSATTTTVAGAPSASLPGTTAP